MEAVVLRPPGWVVVHLLLAQFISKSRKGQETSTLKYATG